jgi:hypothetical protein
MLKLTPFAAPPPLPAEPAEPPVLSKEQTFELFQPNIKVRDLVRVVGPFSSKGTICPPPLARCDTEYYVHYPTRQMFSYSQVERWTPLVLDKLNQQFWFGSSPP